MSHPTYIMLTPQAVTLSSAHTCTCTAVVAFHTAKLAA